MDDLMALCAGLAQREATVPALRPDCAKRIIWTKGQPAQTNTVVVFVHGFSATRHEISPVPEQVAAALGANLFSTRLTGHGCDAGGMGAMTLADWQADLVEAFEVAQALGKEAIFIGCSTGCTLISMALAGGAKAKGVVQVSPNYGLDHWIGQALLDAPGIAKWGHLIAGRTRSFDAISEDHAKYWTLTYPIKAVYTMAEAVRAARTIDYASIATPTLVALNDADKVISPKKARQVMAAWGGPVTHVPLVATPHCDHHGHVMAGDVFSPAQTAPLVERILEWCDQI